MASEDTQNNSNEIQRKRPRDETQLTDMEGKKKALQAHMGMKKHLNRDEIIQRDYRIDIESKVGRRELISLADGEGQGFKCNVSGKILNDSLSYLDHINGRKQQKELGMSLRVERSTPEQVRRRIEANKEADMRVKGEEDSLDRRVDESIRKDMLKKDEMKRSKKERAREKDEEKAREENKKHESCDEGLRDLIGLTGFGK